MANFPARDQEVIRRFVEALADSMKQVEGLDSLGPPTGERPCQARSSPKTVLATRVGVTEASLTVGTGRDQQPHWCSWAGTSC